MKFINTITNFGVSLFYYNTYVLIKKQETCFDEVAVNILTKLGVVE